ncbi:MAG: heterodisulfide reductase-related iron-sulfur binding cluster, partial [Candidatus Methanospirareceae archaeon]
PGLGVEVAQNRVKEALATGAEAIVAPCPSCMFNINIGVRELKAGLEVFDLSDLVALGMGLKIRGAREIAEAVYRVMDSKHIPALEKEMDRWEKLWYPI